MALLSPEGGENRGSTVQPLKEGFEGARVPSFVCRALLARASLEDDEHTSAPVRCIGEGLFKLPEEIPKESEHIGAGPMQILEMDDHRTRSRASHCQQQEGRKNAF